MQYAPLYFGVKHGLFADEGFEVEFMTMRTDLAIAALGTGDVDYITRGGGKKEPLAVDRSALIDFSFLRAAQKELAAQRAKR